MCARKDYIRNETTREELGLLIIYELKGKIKEYRNNWKESLELRLWIETGYH